MTDLSSLIDAAAFWITVQAWKAIVWNAVGVVAVCSAGGSAVYVIHWLFRHPAIRGEGNGNQR